MHIEAHNSQELEKGNPPDDETSSSNAKRRKRAQDDTDQQAATYDTGKGDFERAVQMITLNAHVQVIKKHDTYMKKAATPENTARIISMHFSEQAVESYGNFLGGIRQLRNHDTSAESQDKKQRVEYYWQTAVAVAAGTGDIRSAHDNDHRPQNRLRANEAAGSRSNQPEPEVASNSQPT